MKKQNSRAPEPIEQLQTMSWEDNSLVQQVVKYGSYFIIGLTALIVAAVLIYRLGTSSESSSERDFINADRDFKIFINPSTANSEESKKAFEGLNAILIKHPELHAKYDGMIAQTLINRGDLTGAMEFANRAIVRTTAENKPFYTSYAETTILISDHNYSAALSRAQELHQQMLTDTTKHAYGDTLFAFNLLRIALLQQQLGQKEDEKRTWEDWQRYLQGQQSANISKQAFNAQVDHFQDGDVSILNYIQAREKN